MTKQSTNTKPKQLFWNKPRNNKPLRVGLILVGVFVLVVAAMLIGRRNDPYKIAYNDLSLPSSWKQVSYHHDSGTACFLADNPCPSSSYVFAVSNFDQANSNIIQIKNNLSRKSFIIDETCFRPDCKGYFIKSHNNSVAVRVSAEESTDDTTLVYVYIENR